jgi:hypothetical protein
MHARTFLCRETLWETFEELAREQGAPIDDVLSEAMRSYARQRSYGGSSGEDPSAPTNPNPHDYHSEDAPDMARTGMVRQPTQRMALPTGAAAMRRPAPLSSSPPPRNPQRPNTLPLGPAIGLGKPIGHSLPAPPPRNAPARFPSGVSPLPAPPRNGGLPAPPPPRSMPPPLPPDPYMAPTEPSGPFGRGRVATRLSLTYQNRSVDVTMDRFILGRSKSQADLVLDDPNVSRQHAAIERVGDHWILADLGSTNGCYVDGQRVSRRQLADGDVIEITTHQIRCTLR